MRIGAALFAVFCAVLPNFPCRADDALTLVAGPVGGDGGGAAPKEEKTEFDVVLEGFGDKKIGVIKVVREIVSGLGLKEAKDLVDGAPKPVLEKVAKEDAEKAKAQLEEAGATVPGG